MAITAFPLQAAGVTFGESVMYDLLDDLLGTGVITGLTVTQNGTPNMSVNVAAGRAVVAVPSGGKRIFKNSATSNSGVPGLVNATDWIATFAAAHASLPRVDRVVAQVQDNLVDGGGQNRGMLRVVEGTPTSGATLSNLTGAPAVPSGCEHVAYVLVGAGATTITTANISNASDRAKVGAGTSELDRHVAAVGAVTSNSFGVTTFGATCTSSGTQRLESDSSIVDVDATSSRCTAKRAGLYRLTALYSLVGTIPAGANINLAYSKNGSGQSTIANMRNIGASDATPSPVELSRVIQLAADDYVQGRAQIGSGSANMTVDLELEYLGPAS